MLPRASIILTCTFSELDDVTFKLNKVLLGFGNTFTVNDSTTGTAFILLVLAEPSRTGVAQAVMFKTSVLGFPAHPLDRTPCTVIASPAATVLNLTVIVLPDVDDVITAPAGTVHL
jgi:hypothetical protein